MRPREKRLIVAALGALALLVVVLVISLGSSSRTSAHGCIYLTIPAATGATEIYRCGAAARSTCQSAAVPGAYTADAARMIATECRKAGLPVGP
jgi:hypothetical protein